MAVCVHRRKTLGWPALLSLALHLTLFLSLPIIPPMQPSTSASEPLTVDFIMGKGPAEATSEPPAPTAAPMVPAPPVPQAEIPPPTPAPAPDVPPPPPVQQAEIPPPTPAPAPDVPLPPPVQQAEIPPPTPVPAPMPVPPPPPQSALVHPPRAPPQRAAARAKVNPAGAPGHAPAGQNATSGATNGAAWMGKLKQWWDQHSFYPKEASQTNEGGNVKVHIAIASDGQVTSIEVVQSSGLSVLDAAAVAVFRNAHLPPFPWGTSAQPADVVVTLHYRPADSGG
jgi:periplasmic protein TonB